MPFPWKKAKGKRFSQLVSNHLQPPKRGASLILETGFPASLADLFVKNRDRFNNFNSNSTNTNTNNTNNNINNHNNVVDDNRKKKRKKRAIPAPAPIAIPPPSPLHSTTRNSSNFPTPSSRVLFVPSPRPCGDSVLGDDVANFCDPSDSEAVSGKRVFVAFMKMFFVVMMALGAKRFSVGIAISAFLLLLLEYSGRRLATSASARWACSCLSEFLKRYGKIGVEAPIQEIGVESPVQEMGLGSDLGSSKGSLGNPSAREMEDLVSEIHVVQPSTNLVPPIREIPSVKYEINLRNGKEKWAEKAEEDVIETKQEQEQCISLSELLMSEGNLERATRRSKIKSKIKKLANKLNGSKSKHKKKKNMNEFKCEAFGTESAVATYQGDKEREAEIEFENESTSSSGVDFDADRVNIEDSICLEDSSNNDKNKINIEYGGRERSLSQYLVILVIVLIGLVGGRVLGLVFALSWFLILKFGLRRVTN